MASSYMMTAMGWRSVLCASVLLSLCIIGGDCHEAQMWLREQGGRLLHRKAVSMWSLYEPSHVDPNSACGEALNTMLTSLNNNETWAIKMIDSWGKSSDGILFGNSLYAGVYDECVTTKSPDDSIQGRYCNINIKKTEPGTNSRESVRHAWMPSKLRNVPLPPIAINSPLASFSNSMMYSTCIPDACSQEDFQESLSEVLNNTKYELVRLYCHPDDSVHVFSAGDIAFITLVSFLFFLTLLAGIIDLYIEITNNTTLAKGNLRYFLPFSIYTNTRKLFHISTEKSPDTITCLHGIRVLSMTWVVYGHQQLPTVIYQANLRGMWSKINGFLFQVVSNAFPSVDTFFFIGGFLLSYNVLKQLKKTGRFNLIVFYAHRLVRLMPPIGLVAGLYATIAHFFVSGPYSSFWHYWQGACQKTWWRDILFIDNFVNDPVSPEVGGDCLGQCWYLAVDTQLYVVAPLIILPLYFYNAIGKVWFYLLTLASVIIPASITYTNDLPPASLFFDPKDVEFMDKVYFTPWCRAGPWLVGIGLGYTFYKQDHQKVVLKKWQVVVGWTVAVTTGVLVVFGLWSYNTVPPKAQYDIVTQVVYGGLQRFAWAAAVAWVVYACHNGYGGLADDFLSHPAWQPLSRLTYDIYLVAFPLQFLIAYSGKIPFYYTHINKIIETVSALVIASGIAVIVSLLVDAPIIGLEKILLRRPDGRSISPAPTASGDRDKLSGQDNLSFNPESKEEIVNSSSDSLNMDKLDTITKM